MKITTTYKRIIFTLFAFIPVYFFQTSVLAATDVSDKVEVQTTRLSYDRLSLTSYFDAMLINISPDSLLSPLRIVIENISDPDVSVANADGLIDADKPYFEYPGLSPGESSLYKRWAFDNPLRKRFSYAFYVIDATPATISISGKAVSGLPVVGTINIRDSSSPSKTSFSSIDADGSYQLSIDETWQSPFLMYAEGWVSNTHVRLLSTFALYEGELAKTVNTTPATTAIVESAIGDTAAEIDPLTVEIPPFDIIEMIQAKVEETLAELFNVVGIPEDFNLFLDEIGETGSPTDQLFEVVDFSTDEAGNIVISDVTSPDLSVSHRP